MDRRIITSVMIIMMALSAMGGATLAWFTDQAVVSNTFTAGTVRLNAEDSWDDNAGLVVENWNPGDCSPKSISVVYEGNKRAFMRMKLTEAWYEADGVTPAGLPTTNVTWKVFKGDFTDAMYADQNIEKYEDLYDAADGKWLFDWAAAGYASLRAWFNDANEWEVFELDENLWYLHDDGWYYFAGGTDSNTTMVFNSGEPNEKIINAIDPNNPLDPGMQVQVFIHAVCLSGPGTGNEYQGKKYIISATFQAIQATYEGEWQWNNVDFSSGLPIAP